MQRCSNRNKVAPWLYLSIAHELFALYDSTTVRRRFILCVHRHTDLKNYFKFLLSSVSVIHFSRLHDSVIELNIIP